MSFQLHSILFFVLVFIASYALSVSAEEMMRHPGAYGDPHFTGWDGVNFDFVGEPGKFYCMISDESFHMNMKLDGRIKQVIGKPLQQQTWIKELGIMYRENRIVLVAGEGGDLSHNSSFMNRIEVDGEIVVVKREKDKYTSRDKGVHIQYEKKMSHGVMQFDMYKLVLGHGNEEVVLKVKAGPEVPEEREDGPDAFLHLSVEVVGGRADFWTGGVHGVLGQTLLNARGRARVRGDGSYKTIWNPLLLQMQVEGPNGDGYLDGAVSDYISTGLLHSDCHFSRFNPNLLTSVLSPPLITVSSGYARRYFPGSNPYGVS